MVQTAVLLGADEQTAKDELKESLLFEISLAELTAPAEERRNATALYNPTTLAEMPHLEGLPPSWTQYIQNLFEGVYYLVPSTYLVQPLARISY